jgi:hypothetical protein
MSESGYDLNVPLPTARWGYDFGVCAVCPLLALSGHSPLHRSRPLISPNGHCCPLGQLPDNRLRQHPPKKIIMEDRRMIRIISVAFVLALASSSTQAMPLAATQQPDSMVTQVVAACGVGMTRVNGVCVSRHHKRQARRCARWNGTTCAQWD